MDFFVTMNAVEVNGGGNLLTVFTVKYLLTDLGYSWSESGSPFACLHVTPCSEALSRGCGMLGQLRRGSSVSERKIGFLSWGLVPGWGGGCCLALRQPIHHQRELVGLPLRAGCEGCWRMTKGMNEVMPPWGWVGGCHRRGLRERPQPWTLALGAMMPAQQVDSSEGHY